jgi:hypothetical protein
MADENVEVPLGAEESKAPPTPEISEVSEQAPSAPTLDEDALAEKIAERLLPRVTEVAERRAQGIVDKRTYQFEKVAEYLKAAGGDPKRAAREMAIDEMAEEHLQRQSRAIPSQGGERESTGVSFADETASLLAKIEAESQVGISQDDLKGLIDARTKANKPYRSRSEYFADISTLAIKRAKQGSVTPASVVPEGPGKAGGKRDKDSIVAELAKANARHATTAELQSLLKELDEATG